MQRPFASGSRQAPDPFDQHLEKQGFYRKHTARDSTSLFRVISEQLYDTQQHHLSVRENCVTYMRRHKKFFQNNYNGDFNDYLDKLSKPKTFGTLMELHAIAFLYRRNIIIFREFDTGTYFVKRPDFKDVFRVFISTNNHFDSVFTSDFITNVGFCQAITYEILYKTVFKLPDIIYAVEKMLHANSFESVGTKTEYDELYFKRMTLDDGRVFEFDRPENTNCILDNYLLCHFHNPNFIKFSENFESGNLSLQSFKYNDGNGISYQVTKNSLLYEKYSSCVRQLLNEGITPFPYKVAKALDPDIYRNIEFDSWNDMKRTDFKFWFKREDNLKVGAKCLVKLSNSQLDLFTGYIQEISDKKDTCFVFIEDLGEKRIVPYKFVTPLTCIRTKPWASISHATKHWNGRQKKISYFKNNMRYYNEKIKNQNEYQSHCDYYYKNSIMMEQNFDENNNYQCESYKGEFLYKFKEFTSMDNFNPVPYNIIAMPFSTNHNIDNVKTENNSSDTNKQNSNRNNNEDSNQLLPIPEDNAKQDTRNDEMSDFENRFIEINPFRQNHPEAYYSYNAYDNSMVHMNPYPQYYCMHSTSYSPNQRGVYMQSPMPHCYQPASPNYYSNAYYYPFTTSSVSGCNVNTSPHMANNLTPFHHQNILPTNCSGSINFQAKKSVFQNGSDLPNDIPTLRYFYNLGIDHYKQTSGTASDGGATQENNDQTINKVSEDFKMNLKTEDDSTDVQTNKSDSNNNTTSNNSNIQRPLSYRKNYRYYNNGRKDYRYYNRNSNYGGSKYNSDFNKNENVSRKPQYANARDFSSASSPNEINSNNNINVSANQINSNTNSDGDENKVTPLHNTCTPNSLPPSGNYTPTHHVEGDQQSNSGVYVLPQPSSSFSAGGVSYGVYGPPPLFGQPSATSHHNGGPYQSHHTFPTQPTNHQPFPAPPTNYPHPPPYYPQNSEIPSQGITGSEGGLLETNYTYMTYPPPMYFPNNGNTVSVAPVASASPSGYWYAGSSHQPTVQFPSLHGNQGNPAINNNPQI